MTDYDYQDALTRKVEAFGQSLAKKRQEAIDGRAASGIEDEWRAAEDAYQGIDDANRSERVSGKPSGPNGGYINGPVKSAAVRSTVFLNITRPYTDAAAAKVGDMLLPTDDTPWSIKPSPVPELDAMQQQAIMQQGEIAQALQQLIEDAKSAAQGATKQIEDWMVECQWHGEVRKMIEDCARLGAGVIKGPFPTLRTNRVARQGNGLLEMVIEEKIAPASKAVSPWNFYPDPACGESIHDGSYVWESDTITAKALRELKSLPGYLPWQIDKVLEEGPAGRHKAAGYTLASVKAKDDDQYEIWYGHLTAEREDLEAAGVSIPDEGDVYCPCIVTMVNDRVIKAALHPLDSGEYPYDVMPWTRKPGVPWGSGIPHQIGTAQRMLNAATRNMMDNAGLSAGPQIVVRRSAVTPADGTWQLAPRKFWFVNEDADAQTVASAMMALNIPTMQDQLMAIVQFALRMAEDVTGLPMLMQGQQGDAPETVGGMQMLQNNASVVLRRIARLFDDHVTRPHITRYYEWLMVYGEDDTIKGDFAVEVRGSTALVERDIQNQTIMQMAQMVVNPSFGMDPEKWVTEWLRSQRLDPKRFLLDEEKKQQMAQQPPPVAPQIEAAKIRAEVDLQREQMRLQAGLQKMQVDTDRDAAYVNAEAQRTQIEYQARMQELQLKRDLAMLDYANKREMTLEQVKADLAKTAMQINSVKELAGMKASADAMPKPPIEPAGRAAPGQSYQQ